MSESLNAYVFTRCLGQMDGRGPVIIAARDLADAERHYRNAACDKYRALLKEFGREEDYFRRNADTLADEDLRLMEIKEIPLVSGVIILDEGL